MKTTTKKLIENQVNKELWSAYLYLDIARFYKSKGLLGLNAWFTKQSQEEVEHATKFMDYLQDSGEDFVLTPISGPTKVFKDLKEPLVFQLEHEKVVTSLIVAILEDAKNQKDHFTESFLKWFIDEQFEEETHSLELIQSYDLYMSDCGSGIVEFDKSLKR